MSDAKVPLAYRDSCAHLLIPLNRCRGKTYFLPWKCEVRIASDTHRQEGTRRLTLFSAGRETQLREVPVRRVQEACRQDERAQGSQGRCAEQLRSPGEGAAGTGATGELAVYICRKMAARAGVLKRRNHCVAHLTHIFHRHVLASHTLVDMQPCHIYG